jgi:NAD(P)-dependent dehydrogenase (short-subunit alcohol dehydrogenase family)
MELKDKVVVITGGSGGIGKAMAKAFLAEGAKSIVLADLHEDAVKAAAAEIGCIGTVCDVTKEADIISVVEQTLASEGQIDLFCSNAGAGGNGLLTEAANEVWQGQWDLHVMSHLYAARAVLPSMIERGTGYCVNTASAAGLLAQIGDAAYTTTKHAAIGFAESLQITHGDDGIVVSVICPQYVATNMTGFSEGDDFSGVSGVIGPDEVAEKVLQGMREERFLILTHDEVETFRQRKAADYDRWLTGMRKLRQKIIANDMLNFGKKK